MPSRRSVRPRPEDSIRTPAARARAYWLMKTEPDAFSIDDLQRKGTASWDGVRNFQARNNMDAMKCGDLVLFYHSSCSPPGVVGIARVVRESYADPTAFDPKSPYHDPKSDPDAPRWRMVDVEFVVRLPRMVELEELKATPTLAKMQVVARTRLSVQAVEPEHFAHVVRMGGATVPR